MYSLNDSLVIILEIKKDHYFEEGEDLLLNKHKRIEIDEWELRDLFKDGYFVRLFETNYLMKKKGDTFYIFEELERKEKDGFLLLRLEFKGAYREVDEKEMEEELKEETNE